jgi:UDP-N-acetylglucosamine acyltransferase
LISDASIKFSVNIELDILYKIDANHMTTFIAEQAYVDPRAEIDNDVEIGPFCVIGPGARIGHGTHLVGNVTIMGQVTIGSHNHIYPGAVIGAEPQDASYQGSDTQVVIGNHNMIREGVTVNRGSEKEDGITYIGNHNFLMANAHVAHDCHVGSHTVIANGSLLGGHVHIDDHATLSGSTCVHHFVTIGRFAFIGGLSRVIHDVPPYMLVDGQPARPKCINVVGLKRNAFSAEDIGYISEAHRLLYRAKVGLEQAQESLLSNDQLTPEVNQVLQFVQNQRDGEHGRAREQRRAA